MQGEGEKQPEKPGHGRGRECWCRGAALEVYPGGTTQEEQDVDKYAVEHWHPAYRHSTLLKMDPAYRGKVEADLDFREMMSKAPVQEREFCPVCRALFSPDAAFCRRCGHRREGGAEPAPPLLAGGTAASQSQPNDQVMEIVRVLRARGVRASEHFRKWDERGDGLISEKEFRAAVQDLGVSMNARLCKAVLAGIGEDESGDVSLREIEQALRKAEREFNSNKAQAMLAQGAEAHPRLAGLLGSKRGGHRRDTLAGDAARSATPPARSATPSQTVQRKTVSGTPQDTRRSLLRHLDEDKLVDEDLLPKDTMLVAPDDITWDRRPLRQRSSTEQCVAAAAANEEDGSPKNSEYVALDAATVAALHHPRERRFLLALESSIISSLQNSMIDRIELTTPLPPDLRSLIHSVADYFGLQRVIDQVPDQKDRVKITLLRTTASRVPDRTLARMCEELGVGGEETREPAPQEDQKPSGGGGNPSSARRRSTTPRSNASAGQPTAPAAVASPRNAKAPPADATPRAAKASPRVAKASPRAASPTAGASPLARSKSPLRAAKTSPQTAKSSPQAAKASPKAAKASPKAAKAKAKNSPKVQSK